MKIFRWISAAVSEAIYPLIPQLYNIFNILAKYTFFEDGQVEKLSNNLYILISVCMLFAFGIRLLNGIVNPEIVGDKKKGTRTVFLNAFFSVILMALIPFGFDALREVQSHVIDSALIEKFMLGTTLSDKQDPGQILAAYTFSSTCYPEKTVGDDKIEELYAGTLEDIDDIKYLSKKVTKTHKDSNGEDEYDLHYETILSPLAGGVVVYEMILICMDVALRTVKLGLLELITPIILCGFIFKGSELLQKWTKEVISTYILLFLKVAMIVFMIYGMALLPGFMDRIDFPKGTGDFTKGLIKLFILIGLLQVVKQLPNIINALFGTNIQPRGGIKGRLGEMAAVGKMAQDAWSWAGNKAKGLGGAAIGLGVGAAAGVARNGFKSIATNYNEKYGGKKWTGEGGKIDTWKKENVPRKIFNKIGQTGDKIAQSTHGKSAKEVAAMAGKKVGSTAWNQLKKAPNGLKGLGQGILRGVGTVGDLAKAGYGAGGFAAGMKAGKDMSNIKVPNAIWDDNQGTSETHAIREASGLNRENGTITKKTRRNFAYASDSSKDDNLAAQLREIDNDAALTAEQKKAKKDALRYSGDTARGYAKNAVDSRSHILSADQQRVTTDHIEAKGKDTELQKAIDAKNAMASILSQIGSNLTMSGDITTGQSFTDMSQAISDKAGTENLSTVMDKVMSKLNNDQKSKLEESLKTLQNNQDMFNNCATSIAMNFDGVNMSTSKDLHSAKTSAEIQASNLESVFKSVLDASSASEQRAMNKAVTAGNTLFAMIPEYAQFERGEIYTGAGSDNWEAIPTPYGPMAPSLQKGNGNTQTQNSPTGGQGGQNTQQNNNQPTGSGGSGGNNSGGQPIPHQQGDSSNPDHQNDGSYTPGMYNGPITANVDLGGLEGKLDQINNTISNSGQSVAQAVNNQGNNISKQLNTANERLKHMDAGITTANVKLGNLDKGIGNMSDNIGTLGRNLEDNNKDSDDEDE